MITARELSTAFRSLYGSEPKLYRAPGRVNLIGEHTDYNDGFVMPAAVDFSTWAAISPRNDRLVSVFSENFRDQFKFSLDDPAPQARGNWSDYVRGVAVTMEQSGSRLGGAERLLRGDVPIGSGLSSSASVEVATGLALLGNSGVAVERAELARLCQRAENEFVGMRCGIMDQFISCLGQRGKAMLLDCRSLNHDLLSLSDEVRLVICNTMVKHELAAGEYNSRRAECEAGISHLVRALPGVRALRDVTEAELESHKDRMSEVVYRRCRHVVTENNRVLEGKKALETDNLPEFGRLMNESHQSLRDDYEVSCAELDTMVRLAQQMPSVYGARMTGAGFGGCTINLVFARAAEEFKRRISRAYQAATGINAEVYICRAAAGAQEVIEDLSE